MENRINLFIFGPLISGATLSVASLAIFYFTLPVDYVETSSGMFYKSTLPTLIFYVSQLFFVVGLIITIFSIFKTLGSKNNIIALAIAACIFVFNYVFFYSGFL